MNEHAGPATLLSALIVALFAVLLHERQPPSKAQPVASTPPAVAKDPVAKPAAPSVVDVIAARPAVSAPPVNPRGPDPLPSRASSISLTKQIETKPVPPEQKPAPAETA